MRTPKVYEVTNIYPEKNDCERIKQEKKMFMDLYRSLFLQTDEEVCKSEIYKGRSKKT